MTLLSSALAYPDALLGGPMPQAVTGWESLLCARDAQRLAALRLAGADLCWHPKPLTRDGGGVIVHFRLEARHPGTRTRLGHAGPADFRYGDAEAQVVKMVRSVIGQALAALQPA